MENKSKNKSTCGLLVVFAIVFIFAIIGLILIFGHIVCNLCNTKRTLSMSEIWFLCIIVAIMMGLIYLFIDSCKWIYKISQEEQKIMNEKDEIKKILEDFKNYNKTNVESKTIQKVEFNYKIYIRKMK